MGQQRFHCVKEEKMRANGMAWLKNEPDTSTGYLLDLKVPDRRWQKKQEKEVSEIIC